MYETKREREDLKFWEFVSGSSILSPWCGLKKFHKEDFPKSRESVAKKNGLKISCRLDQGIHRACINNKYLYWYICTYLCKKMNHFLFVTDFERKRFYFFIISHSIVPKYGKSILLFWKILMTWFKKSSDYKYVRT